MSRLERHPLEHIRRQRGWSMPHLARLLALAAAARGLRLSPGRDRIYKWETGREAPGIDYQMLLADVLGIDQGRLAEAEWPGWLPAHDTPHPMTEHGARAVLKELLMADPDRRAFLSLTTGALVDMAADWAAVEPGRLTQAAGGGRVDPALTTWLEARTNELRGLATTSGSECGDLLRGVLRTSIRLMEKGQCSQDIRRRLLCVTANAAQGLGWLHFDQGEYGASSRYWRAAVYAAHTADDRDLGAASLSDIAYMATWLDQPATAAQVLEHARSRTTAPAARALLDVRRARALAVQGEHRATSRALGSAERELDRATPESTPPWVTWMSPADIVADAGRCWLDLGDAHRAVNALTDGLSMLDPRRARTRAVMLAYRAEGSLALHDVPAAAADASAALATAVSTQASRCVALARSTTMRLRPHQALPEVRDLLERNA